MSKKKKKKKVKVYKPARKKVGGLSVEEMAKLCESVKLNKHKLTFLKIVEKY